MVLNPPRKGVEERALRALARRPFAQLLYISCNPKTLARDLRALTEAGARVDRVCPVDLFPQTRHVETVVRVVRP